MSEWKSFQDLKPVVLTKTKSYNSTNTSAINKSNIHIINLILRMIMKHIVLLNIQKNKLI